ncbi:MAG TPA: thioesterase [Methylophaga aminisulfidivorans]|uniref:Thioesterase n=2 Tax=root TaxID=1 RepID=A0A7C1W8J8_9GAMM|nr:thioesterase [Methylophaga sp.]HEC74958.1 thioesterase [Methylophaga aminisulfidivorans]
MEELVMEKIQLICLPFAGGGASIFNEWQPQTMQFDIYGVQLPGREKRFVETPYTCVHEAAQHVVELLIKDTDKTKLTVIFGHSLGAVLAFEVTRLVEQQQLYPNVSLVVSGSPDPWTPRSSRASDEVDDDSFVEKVQAFSGFTHTALEEPMMRELLLPTLRADVQMHEDYRPQNKTPVQSPILVLRGDVDELVSKYDVQQWQHASSERVVFSELSGGHMYFMDDIQPLLAELSDFVKDAMMLGEEV